MIKRRPTLFALLALWWLLPLSAYAASCYSIQDPDERNACLGGVKVERSYCYRIQAPGELVYIDQPESKTSRPRPRPQCKGIT